MQLSAGSCELSLVCPAYNEQQNLPVLLREWEGALSGSGRSFEMIVIDDASTDLSHEVLRLAMNSYARLRVLRLAEQSGQSAALAAGFEAARGRWLVTSDADLQNDPGDLPRLLELAEEFDMVCGWRQCRQDRWTKRLISQLANLRRRRLLDDGMHDSGCGLKLFRKQVAEQILHFDGMHRFLPALAKMEGFSVVEIPVRHRPRFHGKSKYSVFNRFRRPIEDLRGVAWYRARQLSYCSVELTTPATSHSSTLDAAAPEVIERSLEAKDQADAA